MQEDDFYKIIKNTKIYVYTHRYYTRFFGGCCVNYCICWFLEEKRRLSICAFD